MIQGSLIARTNTAIVLDPDVVLVEDPRWAQCLSEFRTAGYVGFDLETYGEDKLIEGLRAWKGHIRLISIGLPSGLSMIADLGGHYDNREQRADKFIDFLAVAKDRLQKIIVCGTALKFDSLWARVKYGWIIPRCRDIMLLSQVLWAGVGVKTKPALKHSLEQIALRCGFPISKQEQKDDWGDKLNNRHFNYAAYDVQIPIKCCKVLIAKLRAEGCLESAIIECEAISSFTEMEFSGQPVCRSRLRTTAEAYRKAHAEAIAPFLAAYPKVNPSSPKDIAEALAKRYPDQDFAGKGGTADNVLAALQDPGLDALCEWRSLKTQVDLLDNLETWWQPVPGWDPDFGVVRTLYRQIAYDEESGNGGAGHGRSSSGQKDYGPNWQNTGKLQPKWKKIGLPPTKAVVCPPPSHDFFAADASQCHARIACKVSLDPFLLKAYVDNYDVHSDMASELAKTRKLGADWTPVNIKKWSKDKHHPNYSTAKALRDASKNCYYGCQNLSAWYTLQATCAGAPDPVFLTEEECKFLIQLFKTKYAGLVSFQRRQISQANTYNFTFHEFGIMGTYGQVIGPTKRRLYLEKQYSKYSEKEDVKGTDCVSFIWMGAEADIIKRSAAIVFRDRKEEWDLVFRNMAHDELNFTVLKEYSQLAAGLVQAALHYAMGLVLSPEVPVDETDSKPEDIIIPDWASK